MSNRLGGKQGTAYLGTNANQPPNWTFSDRDPNQYDINNVSLGDLWLNQDSETVWILVSLAGDSTSKGSLATWTKLEAGGISELNSLTGNTGGVVNADPSANINIVGDGIGITITGNPATHTLTASLVGGGEAAESFPTDSGTATPVAGVLNVKADTASVHAGSTVSFSGAGNTVTFNVTDVNDNTIIGKDSGSALITGGDNTILGQGSAFALTSGDDNTIIGGTAGTGLTSGSNNIILGSGSGSALTTSDSGNTLIGTPGFAGATDFISIATGASGTTILHNYPGTDASTTNGGNIFVGDNAGNFTLAGGAGDASNIGIGTGALTSLTTGARNNAMGNFTLPKLTTGSDNTAIGHNVGFNSGGNTGLVSGQFNVLVGYIAGEAYTGAESSNIIIGGSPGVVGESNVLRIGDGTGTGAEQLNKSFIHGIHGVTPDTADGIPVFIGSTGQLGTVGTAGSSFLQTLTGDGSVVVSPLAGNINIVGDGSTAAVTANPGTHTLTISAIGGGGGSLNDLVGDDGTPVTPLAGIINVITNQAALGAGSSVAFTGTVAHTLTLHVTDANNNTIIGEQAGNATITGTNNTALGYECARAITSGSTNVIIGTGTGAVVTTGSDNTIVGTGAGPSLSTGTNNTIIGTSTGSAYISSESNNILIGAVTTGVGAESNVLRIGANTGTGPGQINKSFIHGIRGITPATADGIPVFIGSAGQLGTVGNGGTTMVQTITGNTGGAVGPALGNINIVGDGTTIEITGNPGTNTLTVVGLGGGGGDLSQLSGDTGFALPAAGIINVIAGTSTQNAGSSVSFSGASNTLTLNVSDSNNNTIIGLGSGNASISGEENIALGIASGIALTSGSFNTFIGFEAGNLVTTGTGNFLCGNASLNAVLKGTTTSTGLYGFGAEAGLLFLHNWGGVVAGNTFVGYGSGSSFNAGQQAANKNNTGCGINSLASLTTGTNNVAVGSSAGSSFTSGSSNTLLGVGAGSSYAVSESSNICIGRNTTGTITESNVLRIGAGTGTGIGQVNKTFIAGIRGITTSISNAIPVLIDSAGQLGTAGGSSVITTLTANTGGAVSATAGNINIVGDGTSVNIVGNPGTSTLTVSAVGGASGPSFFAYLNTTSGSQTGGVLNKVTYDTLPTNTGGAFNLGTSTFTAPTTGLYNFSCGSSIFNTSATKSGYVQLITSSFTIFLFQGNLTGIVTNFIGQTLSTAVGNNTYVRMTAGDTAFISIFQSFAYTLPGRSGGNPAGIPNYFSGSLV